MTDKYTIPFAQYARQEATALEMHYKFEQSLIYIKREAYIDGLMFASSLKPRVAVGEEELQVLKDIRDQINEEIRRINEPQVA